MKIDLVLNNSIANEFIKRVINKLAPVSESINIEIDSNGGFYKVLFTHELNERCPFSIWFSASKGDNFFFNIGSMSDGATVFHNESIEESFDALIDFFDHFLTNSVRQNEIFCRGKLKKIEYEILSSKTFGKFSYLRESYFFCFLRSVESKIFKRWLD